MFVVLRISLLEDSDFDLRLARRSAGFGRSRSEEDICPVSHIVFGLSESLAFVVITRPLERFVIALCHLSFVTEFAWPLPPGRVLTGRSTQS